MDRRFSWKRGYSNWFCLVPPSSKFILRRSTSSQTILWQMCGGQNKNSHIIHTLMHWLENKSPEHLKEIIITFPVRGHSLEIGKGVQENKKKFGLQKNGWINIMNLLLSKKVKTFQFYQFTSLADTWESLVKKGKSEDNLELNRLPLG